MAKSKTSTTAFPKKTGKPLVDRALKARWSEAIDRYRKARTGETIGWDERFEALGDILDADPPLYLGGGFKTAREFLRAEAPDLSERQARTYVRVARYFDPEDEARHGVTKLESLLDYLEASGGVPLAPAKIHADRQKVRIVRGKIQRREPFTDVTTQQLRSAIRDARGGKSSAKEPAEAKAVRKALSTAGLRDVGVRFRAGRFDLTGIRSGKLAAVGRALTKAKLPEEG